MTMMTVIRVKYLEKNSENEEPRGVETSAVSIVNGNSKEVMVNIDCPIGLIIDYIRETVSLEGEIDLCEETTNQIKNLISFPGWTRGIDILVPGGVYFVIKIERDPEGRISRVFPMVSGKSSKIAADIMSRIQAPQARQKSTSLTRKISQDKIGGRNIHQEKRTKLGKPASRAKEGQGR